MMGHKLPQGHGEGRRIWPDVCVFDAGGTSVLPRGGHDQITAGVDEQSNEVSEFLHGIDAQVSAATGLPRGPTVHSLLNNTTDEGNRIPAHVFTARSTAPSAQR